jgi:hypothetical protein
MTTEPVRASASWLTLREPADAAARSGELVESLLSHLLGGRDLVVHDLGSGSGSMARWLAPQLPGAQHWVLYDRDLELLAMAPADPPTVPAGSGPVSLETRRRDITRLDPEELSGAGLVTASALLDMLTAEELDRLVASCAGAGCPVLVTLSVVGRVELEPADPLDEVVQRAFNAHQRRDDGAGLLLGPDAVDRAVSAFAGRGLDVVVRPSPWLLGSNHALLASVWFEGWLGAALEQQPGLQDLTISYRKRRLVEAISGRLEVTVHHQDLLAIPAG